MVDEDSQVSLENLRIEIPGAGGKKSEIVIIEDKETYMFRER